MKPPRDDRQPMPDAGREQTTVMPAPTEHGWDPWPAPKAQRMTQETRPTPKPPKASMEVVSVAGLAQAIREANREARRTRVVLRRLVHVLHWILGMTIVFGITFACLATWYLATGEPHETTEHHHP